MSVRYADIRLNSNIKSHIMKKLLIVLLVSLSAVLPSFAQLVPLNPAPSVQLAWNPSTGSGVTNYSIYMGTNSLQYTCKINCGTNLYLTVTNLTRGVTTYFNVTASAGGLESGFGGEVSYMPVAPPAAPTFKPIVVLVVQNSPSLQAPNWSTLATLSLSADQVSQFYRTQLALPQ